MKFTSRTTPAQRSQATDEYEEVLTKLQPIFADVSGVSPEEMDVHSDLEEDMSVNMLVDLPRIVIMINKTFMINLDVKAVRDEVATLGELVDLIIEEKAFG